MIWHFQVTAGPAGTLGAVGSDDEQLLEFVMAAEQRVRTIFAGFTVTFNRVPPQVVYYLLDDTNFAILLNWTDPNACESGIESTALVTEFGQYSEGRFRDFTSTESPRSSWSRGK